MLLDIVVNLISDVIFIVIVIILTWLFYRLTKRRRLFNFFGINSSKRIFIYLSNLDVVQGGSRGANHITRSFQGNAIANKEAKAANQLHSLFNYFLPSWGDKPGILSKLLIADIDVQVVISPTTMDEIDQSSSFITLGSFAYNTASQYMDKRDDVLGRIQLVEIEVTEAPDNQIDKSPMVSSAVVINTSSDVSYGGTVSPYGKKMERDIEGTAEYYPLPTGTPISLDSPSHSLLNDQTSIIVDGIHPITDTGAGYVERIYDLENERNLFCAAGISELATAGCAYYLKSEWQELYKKYGPKKSFIVVLKFHLDDDIHPVVLFEKSR